MSPCHLKVFTGNAGFFDLTNLKKEIHSQDLEEFKISPGEIVFLKNRNSTLEYIKSLKIYRVESGQDLQAEMEPVEK